MDDAGVVTKAVRTRNSGWLRKLAKIGGWSRHRSLGDAKTSIVSCNTSEPPAFPDDPQWVAHVEIDVGEVGAVGDEVVLPGDFGAAN